MFKRFAPAEELTTSAIKTSAIRGIKRAICDQYPAIEDYIDDIIPKKDNVMESKGKDKTVFITLDGVPLFFRVRDGPYFPTLRLLHKYPMMMQRVRVDKGAIKFVFKGADIMCPGLTSPGGDVSADLPEMAPVAIFAEGKEHALAIGVTKMSTADIRRLNKGIGVEVVHHLDDMLWHNPSFE